MSEEPTSPLDAALDVFVYAPVGLVLTVTEELPKLVAKGRARMGGQVAAARAIGQLAFGPGIRALTGSQQRARPTAPVGPSATSTATRATGPGGGAGFEPDGATPAASTDGRSRSHRPASTSARRTPPTGTSRPPRPAAAFSSTPSTHTDRTVPSSSLAIPGYDALSASQVVQRLAGLSSDELEAVRRYELATRGRRTVLTRVSQLQGS
jgi:hypothetical protein